MREDISCVETGTEAEHQKLSLWVKVAAAIFAFFNSDKQILQYCTERHCCCCCSVIFMHVDSQWHCCLTDLFTVLSSPLCFDRAEQNKIKSRTINWQNITSSSRPQQHQSSSCQLKEFELWLPKYRANNTCLWPVVSIHKPSLTQDCDDNHTSWVRSFGVFL